MLNPYIFAYLAFAFDGLSIRILRHSNLTLFGTPLQGCLFLKAFYSLRIWMKFFCNPTFDCRDIVQCRCLVLFFLHITWSGLKKKRFRIVYSIYQSASQRIDMIIQNSRFVPLLSHHYLCRTPILPLRSINNQPEKSYTIYTLGN